MTEAERLANALATAIKQTDVDDDVIHVARWFVEDSASLLRSQAAEIERLKESNTRLRMENSSHAEHMGRENAALRADHANIVQAYEDKLERLKQEQAEPVPQFRKVGCADWYDGFPDHSDGGGPYESRTLYTAPQGQTALLRQALEALELADDYDTDGAKRRMAAITAIKNHLGEA